jgi:uncharacterized membrane protein
MRRSVEDGSAVDGLTAGRVEAFSDAVLAIAITLLVLQLHAAGGEGSLAHRLGEQWPLYVSYLLSFLNIGIVWLNHHAIFSRLRGVDHVLVLLNLLLLLVVSVLPFPTEVLGDALRDGDFADQRTAALLYAGNFLFASAAFCALWLWAARDRRLIRPEMCNEAIRLRTWRMAGAIPAFAIPVLVAIWSPISAIAIDGAIMISFLLSDPWLEHRVVALNAALARQRAADGSSDREVEEGATTGDRGAGASRAP